MHNHNSLITDSLRSIVNSFGYLLASLPTSKKKATNQVTNTVSNNRPFSKYFDIRHEMLGWMFIGRFYLYREESFCPKFAELAFKYIIQCGSVVTAEMDNHSNGIKNRLERVQYCTLDRCRQL